jgi:diketogulonate reductase-like aldo/keto reductase
MIPSTGELLPVIGLGTWQTFDVDNDMAYPALKSVLSEMNSAGGRLIDSSPMYGNAEAVIGDISSGMLSRNDFFYATKVWTTGLQEGIRQMETSFSRMKRTAMDLVQIHNLTDWKTHLPQLRRMKEAGKIRYIGITHYTDESHEELEKILMAEQLDFVQFNYSMSSRNAEKRLLNAASDRGVATLINRPLAVGNLFGKVEGKPLPAWAAELDIESWAAYFLKYIIAHPAVTCVIPATGKLAHAIDNLKAGTGILPDEITMRKMVNYLNDL